MNNQNYIRIPALMLGLLRDCIRNFTVLLTGFFTYFVSVYKAHPGIFDNFATLNYSYAGEKSHFIFRSANIIALFMQSQKGAARVNHIRARIQVAG